MSGYFTFIVAALATYRLARLVSQERGPGAIFERLRVLMPGGKGSPKEWLSCYYCFSMSASALICFLLWFDGMETSLVQWFLFWLALSGVAVLLNQSLTPKH